MKKTDYEIYLSFSKRPKKYVVTEFGTRKPEVLKYCKRLFKCSDKHINIRPGWIYKDELYLENPNKVGAQIVVVGCYVR